MIFLHVKKNEMAYLHHSQRDLDLNSITQHLVMFRKVRSVRTRKISILIQALFIGCKIPVYLGLFTYL